MLIVSFDAVSDKVFSDKLSAYPNIAAFVKSAEVSLGVKSVFLTNTYPTHCSIATGRLPREHGILDNTEPFPEKNPVWNTAESLFKTRTLWQAAAEAGLQVAAVLWPVTCGSGSIRYNIPEVHIRPGENQIRQNLKEGSRLLQIEMLLKYRKQLKGETQPELDDFITSCAADLLVRKKPDLTFVHLICYDSFSHTYGPVSEALIPAYESLDKNLGRLLAAAGENRPVIIVSDHGCLPVHTSLTPNDLLADMELLKKEHGVYSPGGYGCFFECCGGSVFFHPGLLPEHVTMSVKDRVAGSEGFLRFLSPDEMYVSGREKLPFGYGLKEGYLADNRPCDHKGTHGYPADMPGYDVFYAVRGKGFKPGKTNTGGSILDVAPIAAEILGLDFAVS